MFLKADYNSKCFPEARVQFQRVIFIANVELYQVKLILARYPKRAPTAKMR